MLCTTLLCPAWGQTLPSALERALGVVGTTSCPMQSSSRGQFTPGSLEGTCFGQLLEKKGCLEGPESQARGRHIPLLSCRETEGSSGDEAHSSQQLPWEGSLQPVPTAPQAAAANILPSSLLERQQDAELSTIALFTRQIYDFSIKSPVS